MSKRTIPERWARILILGALIAVASPSSTTATELWIAPTSQIDMGGVGTANNVFWPVTPVGGVRFVVAIPPDLQTFQRATLALIREDPAGAAALHVYVCKAQSGAFVRSDCSGPNDVAFNGASNDLGEVDITAILTPKISDPGTGYIAILAYTTPTTATDHLVGMRFDYASAPLPGFATLGPNTFTGNQTIVGDVSVSGNIAAKYQDVAEWVEARSHFDQGTVVVVDPHHSNQVVQATRPYDTRVVGAVSAQPGVALGEPGPEKVMVAQSGRVRVKVDARYGPIRRGDLLVTSPTPGYAMRSRPMQLGDHTAHRPGTLIGKALEPLATGEGRILVLLTLQ